LGWKRKKKSKLKRGERFRWDSHTGVKREGQRKTTVTRKGGQIGILREKSQRGAASKSQVRTLNKARVKREGETEAFGGWEND